MKKVRINKFRVLSGLFILVTCISGHAQSRMDIDNIDKVVLIGDYERVNAYLLEVERYKQETGKLDYFDYLDDVADAVDKNAELTPAMKLIALSVAKNALSSTENEFASGVMEYQILVRKSRFMPRILRPDFLDKGTDPNTVVDGLRLLTGFLVYLKGIESHSVSLQSNEENQSFSVSPAAIQPGERIIIQGAAPANSQRKNEYLKSEALLLRRYYAREIATLVARVRSEKLLNETEIDRLLQQAGSALEAPPGSANYGVQHSEFWFPWTNK